VGIEFVRTYMSMETMASWGNARMGDRCKGKKIVENTKMVSVMAQWDPKYDAC
jgi:hypothetical protein